MTQWPIINVAHIQIPHWAPYVGGLFRWVLSLLEGFSSLHESQHFEILIQSKSSGDKAILRT